MNTLCSFLSWKPQVQLSLEGRGLPQAGAKPPCPDRSSRWSCATGPFCLLALQGNGSYWALFFPRSYVPFLARKCVPHLLPTFRYLLRGAVAIQHSYYPKKCLSDSGLGSCHEEQPVHQTGAARGIGVPHGCCVVCSPCSELLPAPSSGERKVRGISILTYVLFPKYSLPPFGPVYRRWWEHTVRFCGTQFILSKVFRVTWLFSTAAKWTPAFKNQSVNVL